MCFTSCCTTIHRNPIFSMRYSVLCRVYTDHCGTSEIEHGLCACTVDNPLAKARGLSLRKGAQTMLYLSLVSILITVSHVAFWNINIVAFTRHRSPFFISYCVCCYKIRSYSRHYTNCFITCISITPRQFMLGHGSYHGIEWR